MGRAFSLGHSSIEPDRKRIECAETSIAPRDFVARDRQFQFRKPCQQVLEGGLCHQTGQGQTKADVDARAERQVRVRIAAGPICDLAEIQRMGGRLS